MSLKPGQVGGILGEKSSRFDKLVTAILIIAKLSGYVRWNVYEIKYKKLDQFFFVHPVYAQYNKTFGR